MVSARRASIGVLWMSTFQLGKNPDISDLTNQLPGKIMMILVKAYIYSAGQIR